MQTASKIDFDNWNDFKGGPSIFKTMNDEIEEPQTFGEENPIDSDDIIIDEPQEDFEPELEVEEDPTETIEEVEEQQVLEEIQEPEPLNIPEETPEIEQPIVKKRVNRGGRRKTTK